MKHCGHEFVMAKQNAGDNTTCITRHKLNDGLINYPCVT